MFNAPVPGFGGPMFNTILAGDCVLNTEHQKTFIVNFDDMVPFVWSGLSTLVSERDGDKIAITFTYDPEKGVWVNTLKSGVDPWEGVTIDPRRPHWR